MALISRTLYFFRSAWEGIRHAPFVHAVGIARPPVAGMPEGVYPEKKVIIRFHARDVHSVVSALETAGFAVIESVEMQKPALAA